MLLSSLGAGQPSTTVTAGSTKMLLVLLEGASGLHVGEMVFNAVKD